jgi:hypothetical protein
VKGKEKETNTSRKEEIKHEVKVQGQEEKLRKN